MLRVAPDGTVGPQNQVATATTAPGPKLAPDASGGALVTYQDGLKVMAVRVSASGTAVGAPVEVAAGARPDVAYARGEFSWSGSSLPRPWCRA